MPSTITKPLETAPATQPGTNRGAIHSLALAMLMAALGTSIATVGLPALATSFAASFAQAQWIVISYLLSTTVVIVAAGRLGDVIGHRRLLVTGLVVFTAASAVAGVAPGFGLLIAARTFQGVGAAMMMAMALAMVGAVVPRARTGRAMGLLGTMSAVGTALGPSLGGLLLAAFGWPALFLACVPLGLVTALLAYHFLPADKATTRPPRNSFDHLGMALLAGTLATYTLAMTSVPKSSYLLVVILLGTALLGLALFIIRERKVASPLLPMALFRNHTLSAGFITNICVTAVVMATLVIGPFYLVDGLALHAANVGLVMTVGPLVAAVVGVPAGRLVDRYGASRISRTGLAAMVLGCSALALVSTTLGIPGYLIPLAITTAGFAIFQAANNTAVMAQAQPEQRGVIAGMLSLSRNVGLITGAAAMGALFALGSASSGAASPSATVEAGLHLTFGITTLLMIATWGGVELGRMITRPDHASHSSATHAPTT